MFACERVWRHFCCNLWTAPSTQLGCDTTFAMKPSSRGGSGHEMRCSIGVHSWKEAASTFACYGQRHGTSSQKSEQTRAEHSFASIIVRVEQQSVLLSMPPRVQSAQIASQLPSCCGRRQSGRWIAVDQQNTHEATACSAHASCTEPQPQCSSARRENAPSHETPQRYPCSY